MTGVQTCALPIWGLGVEYSIRIDCKDGKVISDSPKGVDIAFGVRHGEKRIEK